MVRTALTCWKKWKKTKPCPAPDRHGPLTVVRNFKGVYNLHDKNLVLFTAGTKAADEDVVAISDLNDEVVTNKLGERCFGPAAGGCGTGGWGAWRIKNSGLLRW